MPPEPPPFQEAARCDVCGCSFNTFRRRHHCRCCGRTLCHEHSSDQMALPQFGIYTEVRVCNDCYNGFTRSGEAGSHSSSDGVNTVINDVSILNIVADRDSKAEPTARHPYATNDFECKCGMPLCICEAPAPTTKALPLQQSRTPSSSATVSMPKPRRIDGISKNRGSTSNNKPSSMFSHSQMNDTDDKLQMDYEVNGEGLREAIKNGNPVAVKKLLSEGVDANYHDRQGMSLLHLAALFNRTEIAFILMESDASLDYKNAQGETPLDCAPATLQYKMRKKMEEHGKQGPPTSL